MPPESRQRFVVVGGVITIVLAIGIFWYVSRRKASTSKREQTISSIANRYGAVRDWHKSFDRDRDRVILPAGHRAVYTIDVEKATLRPDKKPLLLIGYVFEARTCADKHYLGVKTRDYPDLNFILECKKDALQKVLDQPADSGSYFAVVAHVQAVKRPAFEIDLFVVGPEEDDVGILVEPGDQYILTGTCLDIVFIGEYE